MNNYPGITFVQGQYVVLRTATTQLPSRGWHSKRSHCRNPRTDKLRAVENQGSLGSWKPWKERLKRKVAGGGGGLCCGPVEGLPRMRPYMEALDLLMFERRFREKWLKAKFGYNKNSFFLTRFIDSYFIESYFLSLFLGLPDMAKILIWNISSSLLLFIEKNSASYFILFKKWLNWLFYILFFFKN